MAMRMMAPAKRLKPLSFVCMRCASTLAQRMEALHTGSTKNMVPTPLQTKSVKGHTNRLRSGNNPSGKLRDTAATATTNNSSTSHQAGRKGRRRRGSMKKRDATVLRSDASPSIAATEARVNPLKSLNRDPEAPIPVEPPESVPVPELAHGLDRVLFNPGVYYLQDPRSNVYNFDPYLQTITPVKDFNFDALTQYITSSRDSTLDELARAHGLKIVGSTSSMTSVLAQHHFFLSNWRPIDAKRLSTAFAKKLKTFTTAQRAPASIYLRHNKGIYAIDADKSLDSGETVLSFLGRSMEKMLTLRPEEFSKLRKENSAEAPTEKSREAYHYSKLGNILMRSQLDCHDSRLPGTGTFDLKTRAVLPVRLDVKNASRGAGYQIFHSVGLLESFEREYYDMIRAAFLKYSLQVRIGNMDGIFVAFHNTERIFGFQYISLSEMDEAIHGSSSEAVASQEFNMSLRQLDSVLATAIEKYPEQSMCLTFAAREDKKPTLDVIIEPLSDDEIVRRQRGEVLEALKAVQKTERFGKAVKTGSGATEGTLEKMSTTLEKMISKENHDARSSNAAPKQSTPEDSPGPSHTTPHASPLDTPVNASSSPPPPRSSAPKEMLMLRLTGQSSIDGQETSGPPSPTPSQKWTFSYTTTHITSQPDIKKELALLREKQAFAFTDVYDSVPEDGGERTTNPFLSTLKKMSDQGRVKLRERMEETDGAPVVVWRDKTRAGAGPGVGGGGESAKVLEKQYIANFTR